MLLNMKKIVVCVFLTKISSLENNIRATKSKRGPRICTNNQKIDLSGNLTKHEEVLFALCGVISLETKLGFVKEGIS